MKLRSIYFCLPVVLSLFATLPAQADMKQTLVDKGVSIVEKAAADVHGLLSKAENLGFVVNEIRMEVTTSPRIEVFFRDVGDTGQLDALLKGASKTEEATLRLLQATRKFEIAHYSPIGVKLTTGVALPKVEIITNFVK